MSEITFICCYNNLNQFNNFVATLKNQTCKYNLIAIDNTGNKKFKSCASAYNSVIDQVKTKYVIYSHQDILLNDNDTLENFLNYLHKINKHDILGVAGVKFEIPGTITNIMHKNNNTGEMVSAGVHKMKGKFMEVDTIDECFFGGHSEHFKINKFNEKLCNGWHLYAVERCLNTIAQSSRRGEERRGEERRGITFIFVM